MATGPDLRIGDADREAAAAALREHYASGRLTLEEFNLRLDAAFAATTQGQLRRITEDLPYVADPSASRPVTPVGPRRERAREDYRTSRGRGRSPGMLPVIIAAFTAWLLAFNLLLPHLRLFPGRFAIFLLIFTAIRSLLRRVWRGGRSMRPGYPRRWR